MRECPVPILASHITAQIGHGTVISPASAQFSCSRFKSSAEGHQTGNVRRRDVGLRVCTRRSRRFGSGATSKWRQGNLLMISSPQVSELAMTRSSFEKEGPGGLRLLSNKWQIQNDM